MSNLLHLLHVFPTFSPGGSQVRFATLANQLAGEMRHSIVSIAGNYDAQSLLGQHVQYRLIDPPRESLAPALFGYARLLRTLRPDLLLTYNWGAMDAVMGGLAARICPIVHAEDGFGPDEARRLKLRRVLARRVILRRTYRTAVPSRNLLRIALDDYRLPPHKVQLIPNGVDTVRFHPGGNKEMRSRWGITEEEFVIGSVGRLRGEKNLGLLLCAFAEAGIDGARLVLVGDGEREAELRRLAADRGISGKVVFAGAMGDPAPCYRAFDLFAMSSSTEQMPLALLEGMASGLPTLCTDVGDTAVILDSNRPPEVVAKDDLPGYTNALRAWARPDAPRRETGARNRQRCLAHYSLEGMVGAWRELYRHAISG